MVIIFEQYQLMFNDLLFWLYIATLVTDIATGNIKAWVTNDVDSSVGTAGTLKHVALLGLVLILLPTLDAYVGNNTISNAILIYYAYQYMVSIIENLGEMGWDFPEPVQQRLRRLKDEETKL